MASRFQVLVFGDLSIPYHGELRRLLGKTHDCALASLFSDTHHVLRSEISRLSPSQRDGFSHSSNLSELLIARESSQIPNCALDCALVCLCHIASFVSYTNEPGKTYPRQSHSSLYGSCIGLLAAVAVSCAENVLDLVEVAPHIVALAFRLGHMVQTRTASVVSRAEGQLSCSSVVAGFDEDTIAPCLEAYCTSRGLASVSRVYISAIGSGSITISGPPSHLKDFLLHHPTFKAGKIGVAGLFHSSRLYTTADVDALVSGLDASLRSRAVRLDVVANSFEAVKHSQEATCKELLQRVVCDILLHRLRWDLAIETAPRTVGSSAFSEVEIIPFASSGVESLAAALRSSEAIRSVDVLSTVPLPPQSESESTSGSKSDRSRIAIIGFSGRFPEADNNEAFWELLAAGLDVHKEIPKDRFDPWLYYDSTGEKKNTSGVTMGCFVRHPDLFDARFFGMSPREADQADPAQRLALMTAYEAMEMAGFVPDSTPSTQRSRVGVFYGTASDDYRETNAAQNIDTYFVPGGSRAFLPARINYHFRFSGPSFDVDTACSSGLAAIHIACNSLLAADCDVAIAGGTNILTNPDNWAGLDRAHFLSRTGNCKTFDDGADGYCRAESVATVLLKRLDDALLDGDPVYGTILGAYTNHSAEAVSITRPHSGAQRSIFGRILTSSHVDSSSVSYVEMHGTGTQHGDACEMDSVLNVFAPEGCRRDKALYLGSAKANIGHGESASGVSSLIKVLLMMQKSTIPRHVGIKTKINRNFPTDLAQRNVHIPFETTPWLRPDPKESPCGRIAFVNNFGAAGGNSSVLVQDGPVRSGVEDDDPRQFHIVAVSAKSQTSFRNNMLALSKYLDAHPLVSLGSLSYTTTARRVHYGYRTAVAGSSVRDIREALEKAAMTEKHLSTAGSATPLGFCFTGQGSQYLSMAKKLLALPRFLFLTKALEDIVLLQGFQPILDVLEGTTHLPMEQLPPVKVQLAITCLQIALGKLLTGLGIRPQVVIGHSLGEYAAMNIAGVLSDADTIHLVGTRATLLTEHCSMGTHAMLAVKASVDKVVPFLSRRPGLEIACVNGSEETVVAGPRDAINSLVDVLDTQSARTTLLKVQFAFHSAQVESMLASFRQSCASVVFKDPAVPLLSPLLGKTISDVADFGFPADYLTRHCRETVNFHNSLLSAADSGVISDKTVWVEVGPHPVCGNMLKSALGSLAKSLPTLRRDEDDWKVFTSTLTSLYCSGLSINWDEYHGGLTKNKQVLCLPSYQWELKSHWIPYVHDWCLTKGDAPPEPQLLAHTRPDFRHGPFTTSVQDIISEKYTGDEACITARSDVQHPDFREVLLAHRVNGRPVCSSAVYADMALTLFTRLLEHSAVRFDKSDIGIDVSNMVADKALILNDDPSQLVEMKASAQWSTRRATFTICSIPGTGAEVSHHAKCTGSFVEKSQWRREYQRRDFLVKARVDHLRRSIHDNSGSVHLIKTGMFYKLFSALVDYHPSFKGCRELVMHSAELESSAKVKFATPPGTADKWMTPPYWLDSLGQITGFTMNANDEVDSKNQVFINHGWESMKLIEPLSEDVTYTTYLKMRQRDKSTYVGDVYIFNEGVGDIVAVYEGVAFSAVQRSVLDKVLPKPKTNADTSRTVLLSKPVHESQGPESGLEQPTELPVLLPSHKDDVSADRIRAIIAEEVGAAVSDVQDEAKLDELGVDSLLVLTISDRMLEEVHVKVDSAAFIACTTVGEFIQLVSGSSTPSSDSTPPVTPPPTTRELDRGDARLSRGVEAALFSLSIDSDEYSHIEDPNDEDKQTLPLGIVAPAPTLPRQPTQVPPATSGLLQGSPLTCSRRVWLFPDGSGSATSYLPIPDVDAAKVAVYGLSSPYVRHGDSKPCQFEELTTAYLTEMRRRQPAGPYIVGGWSAGGISAYDAAQRLVADGESVDGLILLDSPRPIGLRELPPRLYGELDKLNVFGSDGQRPPSWLLAHFVLFAGILSTYKPRVWESTKSLPTWALWARNGVDEDGLIEIWPDDPDNMLWLLHRRARLDANGWDELVGPASITVDVVEGSHHFNMLKQPGANKVADFIRRAVTCMSGGVL
ncbi:polyketide synthetase PksP [Metarhizium album ARSEF 1941]|uniref:Polyketide synthetase PksP n=1 Tax=Metarhizium album (strain ARSEF 1941) TaxID=1081103 RepID=A0A0B2WMT9_METAS|nr:polyketide synthetase PksP [Metarhizium album ARSEF 1941]KHN94792.1 polyketide synthetase PksP [Metarhizium album ARSEF 1941]